MSTLSVSGFSCLDELQFETSPVVAIIGSQGSGKSVTIKLNYFAADINREHISCAERGLSFEEFKKHLANKFRVWFPVEAWGQKRFIISYYSDDFYVRIMRRMKSGRPSEELAFTFSDWYEDFYLKSRDAFLQANARSLDEDLFAQELKVSADPLEATLKMRLGIRQNIRRRLGASFIENQTFIPAGRAFFTGIGKLVAAFNNLGAIDPLTIKFAEQFSEIRSRAGSTGNLMRIRRKSLETVERDRKYSEQFFGGELVFEPGSERVKITDGRQVPFTAMSSGQQELLPMWSIIQYLSELEAFRDGNARSFRELIYIEEPEAHLFPRAQSDFLAYLFESLKFSDDRKSLILTTHSPYIMGRLNVFLKSGILSRRKKKNTDINDIVPRERWIRPQDFRAYAMMDGGMWNIVDSDGLIDSSYLDSISDDIASDFDRLLEVEMEI
ncbi:AAA family ATPase [Novosphingobium olei]|uniref:AAA family ATPase n=1 Tax=Novosphingobium olei TaxID=2728851 RepID=UPI00308EB3D1|nr:AAA family ATPase [Novosphingobium olei]